MNSNLLLPISSVDKEDEFIVGEKATVLGQLFGHGFTVPKSFVVTKQAYKLFFKENNLNLKIKHLLAGANLSDPNSVSQTSQSIVNTIEACPFPPEISSLFFELFEYEKLHHVIITPSHNHFSQKNPFMSYVWEAKGESAALTVVKKLWALSYSPNALSQMNSSGNEIQEPALVIQEVINPQKSGSMFTSEAREESDCIRIQAVLGNNISSELAFDEYVVKKPSAVYSEEYPDPGWNIKEIHVNPQTVMYKEISLQSKSGVKGSLAASQKLSDHEILQLAKIGQDIEDVFYFPQKISWGISKNKFYIFFSQTFSTEVFSKLISEDVVVDEPVLSSSIYSEVLFQGRGMGKGVSVGRVKFIHKDSDLQHISSDSVIVTQKVTPSFKEAFKKAVGIVTLEKKSSSYVSTYSKEYGIPVVVDAGEGFNLLKDGMLITVDGNTGEVWRGSKKSLQNTKAQSTALKIFVEIDSNNQSIHKSEADGVFTISIDHIIKAMGVHPKKLLYESKLTELEQYLEKFVLQVCQEWYPKPVYYKFSDLTSDEYRELDSGKQFEEEEKNPLLGYRGLLRELSEPYLFDLELRVLKKIREKHRINNIHLLFPFVRSKKELTEAIKHLERQGLRKSYISRKAVSVNTAESAIFISETIKAGIDEIFVNIKDLVSTAGGLDFENHEQINNRINSLGVFLEIIKREADSEGILVGAYNIPSSFHEKFLDEIVAKQILVISVDKSFIETTKAYVRGLERNIMSGLRVK